MREKLMEKFEEADLADIGFFLMFTAMFLVVVSIMVGIGIAMIGSLLGIGGCEVPQ